MRSEFHPPDNEMKREERASSEVIVDRPAEYAQDMEFGKCGVDDTLRVVRDVEQVASLKTQSNELNVT